MAIILSIDTSTTVCSVALHKEEKLLAKTTLFSDYTHSSMLTTLVQNIMDTNNLPLSELHAIALSKGPGSYTGLRIGVSTAKGLCFGLDVPLIAINTLEAFALQVIPYYKGMGYLYCPMIDARRMEVYCSILDENLQILQQTEAKIINKDSFNEFLSNKKVIFFGDGASKCRAILDSQNAVFLENMYPDAAQIGQLAINKYLQNHFEDVSYFEPYYLKEFIAFQ
jgi:tRNA threonylcarbamoyladenosine biosynthesis protein TsaB